MTISEKIAQLRPLIGYDTNKDIRDTVNEYDFKRAVEHALRKICKNAKVVMKSVFVPFVQYSQFFDIPLENSGMLGFEEVAIKGIHIKTSDGSTIEITEEEIEDVVQNTYNLNNSYYRIGIRRLGTSKKIQTNILLDSQPALGVYSSITAFPTASKITAVSTTNGYYVVNLSKANENKYSSAQITNVSGADLTLDQTIQTDTNYLWAVGDKVYISSSLPYLASLYIQSLPKIGYFDTYTTIPIDDVYLDYIDVIALEYLYQIIKGRFPEQTQMYLTQISLVKDTMKEIRQIANKRTGFLKVKPFNFIPNEYGR